MIKSVVTLILLTSCGTSSTASLSNSRQLSSSFDTVNTVLWWFPENTETVTVARGPFKAIAVGPKSPQKDLTRIFQQVSFGPLLALQDGKFYDQILGQTVLLSIEASRKFRSPASLGGMLYEGCSIILFQEGFDSIKDSLVKSLKATAKEVREIEGHQVIVLEEKQESDIWKFHVTFPQKNLLVCSTDEGFLRDTLNRKNRTGERRALPEQLPEWSHVDVQAQFWAVRHYERNDYARDPSSPLSGQQKSFNIPDKEAIGLVYTFDPGRANIIKVKYLSSNKEAARLAKQYWDPPTYELKPEIRIDKPGVVDISFIPDESGPYTIMLLLLFGAQGHGVYF